MTADEPRPPATPPNFDSMGGAILFTAFVFAIGGATSAICLGGVALGVLTAKALGL